MPHLSISGPLEGQLELPSLISDILLFYWDKRRRTRFNFFRFLLLNFFHKVCVELGNKVYNRAIVSLLRNLAEKEQVYLVCTFCSPFANNLTLFFVGKLYMSRLSTLYVFDCRRRCWQEAKSVFSFWSRFISWRLWRRKRALACIESKFTPLWQSPRLAVTTEKGGRNQWQRRYTL